MEDWSFPPKFNPDYLPDPASPYWFPKRETMDPGDREKAILERLKEITRYAYAKSPFYRRKWDDAGFHPDHLKSLEDFEDKVPVVTKQDLREAQTRAPKFGDYLCIPESEIHHIHGLVFRQHPVRCPHDRVPAPHRIAVADREILRRHCAHCSCSVRDALPD